MYVRRKRLDARLDAFFFNNVADRREPPPSGHLRWIGRALASAWRVVGQGADLAEYIEFHGASGAVYRYLAPDDRTATRMAGGYVLVSRGADGPILLYAGVTD